MSLIHNETVVFGESKVYFTEIRSMAIPNAQLLQIKQVAVECTMINLRVLTIMPTIPALPSGPTGSFYQF